MAENTMEISLGAGQVVGIAAAVTALKGLGKVLSSISDGVKEAFTVRGYRDYLQTVSRFGKNLTNQLLVLQMAFGRLKVAIAKAFAPILEVVVPYINQAIFALIRFAGVVRQFLSGLFAGIRGNDGLAQSAENAADAENSLAKAATSAGKAAKRSLMGLDQLERLNAPTGGGSSYSFGAYDDTVTPEVQGMVDKLMAVLAPLLTINLEPLKAALQGLWAALANLAQTVGAALQWLWYEVLTPFAAWLLETFAPVLTDNVTAALNFVTAAITPVITGMQSLWQTLQPIMDYIGDGVVQGLNQWRGAFDLLAQAFREKSPQITAVFQNVGQAVVGVWNLIKPVLSALRSGAGNTFQHIITSAVTMAGLVTDTLAGLTGYLAGVFTGDWEQAWDGIQDYMRSFVNLIIGLLNTLVNRVATSLNSIINAANRLSFTVPDWVPDIGGSRFGFNLRNVSAPQIPYLARGAVLPANKPFLAMVGDQKHGTNIEAPLSTIEGAVSGVMAQQTAAILAGFEASTQVQKEILEAVLGIRIGDDIIGNAVARYGRKQAVLRGGVL